MSAWAIRLAIVAAILIALSALAPKAAEIVRLSYRLQVASTPEQEQDAFLAINLCKHYYSVTLFDREGQVVPVTQPLPRELVSAVVIDWGWGFKFRHELVRQGNVGRLLGPWGLTPQERGESGNASAP